MPWMEPNRQWRDPLPVQGECLTTLPVEASYKEKRVKTNSKGERVMTEVNSMYHAQSRSDALISQIDKLESLAHHTVVDPAFDQFDADTEDILTTIYGNNHQYVESYKYATVAEAEALVNLPESAQEPQSRDMPKKGLQQRRQVLQGILTELQALEMQEADALTGEDREDPPGPS